MRPSGSSSSGISDRLIRLGVGALALFCVCARVDAAQVTLVWDPNTEPDVAGYRLYSGAVGGGFGAVTNVHQATSCVVGGLMPNETYAFYVTCYNTAGLESEPSNVVQYTVPESGDGAPEVSSLTYTAGGLQMQWAAVPGTTYRVLYKDDLSAGTWQVLDEFVALDTSGYFVDVGSKSIARRFYRLEVVP